MNQKSIGKSSRRFPSSLLAFVIGFTYARSSEDVKVVHTFRLPPGPQFTGALAPNTKLQGAELLLKDQIKGPESLIVEDGTIYAAVEDGRILKVVNGKIVKEVILVKDKECRKLKLKKMTR